MIAYKYDRFKYLGFSGKTGAVVSFLTVAALIVLNIVAGEPGALSVVMISLLYCVLMYFFSSWPNVTCDDEALFVEFLGWPIKIPWADLLGVKEVYSLPKRAWLVTAKKITFIHYLFGFQYSLKFVPGFLIWEGIPNRGELLSKIRGRAKAAK